MALLAVAAVCLSVPVGGLSAGVNASMSQDRRVMTDTDEAVASFMACLNEAAKTLAGQTAAVVESPATLFDLHAPIAVPSIPTDDRPVVSIQPHLSLLNLPPPAALS